MNIQIEKSHSHIIYLFTESQLTLRIEEKGIYRYGMQESPLRKSFSIGFSGQIEDEEKSP